jgi:hypothetical protein
MSAESKNVFYIHTCNPLNPTVEKAKNPDKSEIISFLENDSFNIGSAESLDKDYFTNYRQEETKKMSFVLKNDEAYTFLKNNSWASFWTEMKKQTIVPEDSLTYYVGNYMRNVEEKMINYFIIAIRVDTGIISRKIQEIYENQISKSEDALKIPDISKNNFVFLSLLATNIIYDREFECENNNTISKYQCVNSQSTCGNSQYSSEHPRLLRVIDFLHNIFHD